MKKLSEYFAILDDSKAFKYKDINVVMEIPTKIDNPWNEPVKNDIWYLLENRYAVAFSLTDFLVMKISIAKLTILFQKLNTEKLNEIRIILAQGGVVPDPKLFAGYKLGYYASNYLNYLNLLSKPKKSEQDINFITLIDGIKHQLDFYFNRKDTEIKLEKPNTDI